MTDEQQTSQALDNAGVRVPPPILLIVAILAGYGLQRLWALELTNWSGWYVAAWALIGVSVVILIGCWVQFYQAKPIFSHTNHRAISSRAGSTAFPGTPFMWRACSCSWVSPY